MKLKEYLWSIKGVSVLLELLNLVNRRTELASFSTVTLIIRNQSLKIIADKIMIRKIILIDYER